MMMSSENNECNAAEKSESIESENSSVDKSGSGTSASIVLSEASSKEMDKRMAIIESEEKHVRKARYLLALATVVCAAVVTVAVFCSSKRNEHRTFKNEYEIYANHVITSAEWETKHNFKLMEELSAAITSSAIMNEESFPNVTHPHYEIFAGYSDSFGGVVSTVYAPIVQDNEREQWEDYSVKNKGWLDESVNLRVVHPGHLEELYKHQLDKKSRANIDDAFDRRIKEIAAKNKSNASDIGFSISDTIYHYENGMKVAEPIHAAKQYAPIWQITPPTPAVINENLFDDEVFTKLYHSMIASNQNVLSEAFTVKHLFDFLFDENNRDRKNLPHTYFLEPVYDSFALRPNIVGVLLAIMPFDNLFDYILPESTKGIVCVISDSCNNTMSFRLDGHEVLFLGFEDHHDPSFDNFVRSKSLELYDRQVDGLCEHSIHVYPTKTFQQKYETNKPALYASIVAISFALMSILILVYDSTVTKRQEKTMKSALKSGALIASLFPANVRERLMADNNNDDDDDNTMAEKYAPNKKEMNFRTRPIADFFPNTTLMFADISGFTAWSSTRDPHQVFDLLETIYCAFDAIAKKRRIFKVETVGDCYVAVCGLPNPRVDHAVAMAKFARECLSKMNSLTKELEVTLGPDTAALAFRVGLHSGPVTGGVLRGENARFQLFGDTVNTASRMESTGLPNRIQISQTTADLLIEASKGHWIVPRGEVVNAKGKGQLTTYWLTVTDTTKSSHSTMSQTVSVEENEWTHPQNNKDQSLMDEKIQRLVDWNTDVLLRFLKLVVARRDKQQNAGEVDWNTESFVNTSILEEVVEIITLPNFSMATGDRDEEIVDDQAAKQLREYVHSIALMYRTNHFHNFEHASHVTMSVIKLLGRIVPRSNSLDNKNENRALALHDHTYGITSDPLTQFACVFAALIHDVDHEGVTNSQLVKEQAPAAITFQGKSVAEQKSLHLSWDLLMEPRFAILRKTLCASEVEVKRFRQLVVNAVMATDIMAPDLKVIRQRRWDTAFSTIQKKEDESETVNRKATIVIEHLIQASDVCHTMQHWHIYRKWNESLFQEMTKAYHDGRSDQNPADTWYTGEIGFFDFYIIPLAKKLADCGVFGVSSDEYLNYAIKNRDEWEARGKDIVRDMVEAYAK